MPGHPKISTRKVDALIPYARNARTHSAEQIDQIAASIKEFGWTNPVLVDGENGIIAGHGRVLAARKLGQKDVPVIELAHLSDAQRRAYILADNKLALNAGWDDSLLAIELQDLASLDFDVSITGFSEDEIDRLNPEEASSGMTDEDAIPGLTATPVTVLGDVWLLGKHRLMCGDSTSADDVETLMAGAVADMVFTDPPYNVAYSGSGEVNRLGGIENDDMDDASFNDFLDAVFDCYLLSMKPLAPIYVCHPDSKSAPKLAFERSFGERFKKSSTIIWVKQSAGMGWQDYRVQHEPILYGWKEGDGSHYYCGDRAKTTVWEIGRDAQANYVHPMQKPVALPAEAIANSSKKGQVVLDMFGGSGSTLIACEKTGRVNRSMELDPKYCDVIVRRWQDHTGKKARHAVTGDTFDDVLARSTQSQKQVS